MATGDMHQRDPKIIIAKLWSLYWSNRLKSESAVGLRDGWTIVGIWTTNKLGEELPSDVALRPPTYVTCSVGDRSHSERETVVPLRFWSLKLYSLTSSIGLTKSRVRRFLRLSADRGFLGPRPSFRVYCTGQPTRHLPAENGAGQKWCSFDDLCDSIACGRKTTADEETVAASGRARWTSLSFDRRRRSWLARYGGLEYWTTGHWDE